MRTRITTQAHKIVGRSKLAGTCAIDATVGNGVDTMFLAREVGSDGLVIGFDVQREALAAATARLKEAGLLERVTLIHDSHERIEDYLSRLRRREVSACLFNLGYLPGSNRSVVTKPYSTVRALAAASRRLMPNGVISIVAYKGHVGGKEEAAAVRNWAGGLLKAEFAVSRPRDDLISSDIPELTIIRRINDARTLCA